MSNPLRDKSLEQHRYDKKARSLSASSLSDQIYSESLDDFPAFLHDSFRFYYLSIHQHLSSESTVLELGSGFGRHTLLLAKSGADVIASDISSDSLSLLSSIYSDYPNITTCQCDLENLPFAPNTFDLICSAGCLSYADNQIVLQSILTILKPGGAFVCIDTLNHNPIYRLNRIFHYLKGNRSLSTLQRMPTMSLISQYRDSFSAFSVKYFGIAAFLYPIINFFTGSKLAASFVQSFDRLLILKYLSFKFVFTATK